MDGSPVGRGWVVGLFAIAALWTGLLLGVSFLATPVKFLAPSLSLAVALDVGRHTFAVFNKVEWLLAVATLFLLFGVRSRFSALMIIVICGVVVAETFWLLPELDRRVGLIIAGQQPPASTRHSLYIVLEIVKLIALVTVSIDMARKLLSRSHPS